MTVLGIIPARYQSSRLPGKPLVDINGKTMIRRVYDRAKLALDQVVIATDDERIKVEAESFGAEVIMTDPNHSTGTNRCLEAYKKWSADNGSCEVIINIQGDEPLLEANELISLKALFKHPEVELGTLVKAIENQSELDNRSGCFTVINKEDEALYFSRQLIPFLRDVPYEQWLQKHTFYKHIGLYAYRPDALEAFAAMSPSSLEKAESLEQNRWLENGGRIKVAYTKNESLSVDTPEDLEEIRKIVAKLEG